MKQASKRRHRFTFAISVTPTLGPYGIRHINLPGGSPYEPQVDTLELRTPCYLAISATNLQGPFSPPEFFAQYSELLKDATLVTKIGFSIFVYSVPKRD